jgi:hypothetical protein
LTASTHDAVIRTRLPRSGRTGGRFRTEERPILLAGDSSARGTSLGDHLKSGGLPVALVTIGVALFWLLFPGVSRWVLHHPGPDGVVWVGAFGVVLFAGAFLSLIVLLQVQIGGAS